MQVAQIMTQEVISITPSASVHEAAALMLHHKIRCLPVIDENHKLAGIVTKTNLMHRVELGTERPRRIAQDFLGGINILAGDYVHSHGRRVRDVMETEVTSATEDMTLDQAVESMERRRVKTLPVTCAGRVVGIVSQTDLVRALTLQGRALSPARTDAVIREELWNELAKQPWSAREMSVTVADGVVKLWGAISDERQHRAILVLAENLPGVKEVEDHLRWIDLPAAYCAREGQFSI